MKRRVFGAFGWLFGGKLRRFGFVFAVVIMSAVLVFYFAHPASAATQVATSTSNLATQYSQQRKTWFDGTEYWAGFYDGANTSIDFYYSSNGSSWTQNTSATITGVTNTSGGFSVIGDSSNAFIVYLDASSVPQASQAIANGGNE